ncbi:MAG: serine/threonine-protein kinase [Trueperaceae bacterium]|nr:serine/threonine-protein kinase [Trueperaceae bacterium]
MNLIGARFGEGYQVLREIARGAVARVYLASDGAHVKVVKVFPPEHAARADREYDIGHGLRHDNLNPVLGTVRLEGHRGVVMPLVPGKRFGTWLPPAPRRERIRALDGLLAGLGWLHQRGVVHRDVKPENVLVTREARAVLIDYDLAVSIDDAAARKTTAGTALYLSPEQARGQAAEPASDLYAAGVMLYRALTGALPFEGTLREVMDGHRDDQVRPPSTFDPALAPFDAPVMRLLAKDPAERYQGAEAARRDLRDASDAQ